MNKNNPMLNVRRGNLYDYPKYYDVIFGSDWKAEFEFLSACFKKHATHDVKRLFEPACGTGRLLWQFAKSGYEVAGNDLNPKAVAYCNARLARHGLPESAVVGDMSAFRVDRKVDAAFNMINSFRHLTAADAALGHLQCVADALTQGGVYVLGLHLTPTRGTPIDEESWSARRGHLAVLSRMKTEKLNRRARRETVSMCFDVYTPTKCFRLVDEFDFKTYTARQMDDLFTKAPDLERVATYDFAYDVTSPIEVTAETEDVVFVMRKR